MKRTEKKEWDNMDLFEKIRGAVKDDNQLSVTNILINKVKKLMNYLECPPFYKHPECDIRSPHHNADNTLCPECWNNWFNKEK